MLSGPRIAVFGFVGLLISVLIACIDSGGAWNGSRMREKPTPGVNPAERARSVFATVYRQHRTFGRSTPPPPLPADPHAYAMDLAGRDYPEPHPNHMVHWADNTEHTFWYAEFRGLPFRCLWGWRAEGTFASPTSAPTTSFIEIPTRGYEGPWRLPISPLWIGLAANTAFWGFLASVGWRLVSAEWRRLAQIGPNSRRARGLCENCEYPRAETPGPCPECGRATR